MRTRACETDHIKLFVEEMVNSSITRWQINNKNVSDNDGTHGNYLRVAYKDALGSQYLVAWINTMSAMDTYPAAYT
jgi:hypothetical protein